MYMKERERERERERASPPEPFLFLFHPHSRMAGRVQRPSRPRRRAEGQSWAKRHLGHGFGLYELLVNTGHEFYMQYFKTSSDSNLCPSLIFGPYYYPQYCCGC